MITARHRDMTIAALCIGSGLLSAFLALRGREDPALTDQITTLEVVVAARDLDGSLPLNATTDLALQQIQVISGTPTLQSLVKGTDLEALTGQSLVAAVQKGSVLTLTHIARRQDLRVRGVDGRALCLDLGAEALFSGLLRPDDQIDIIVSTPRPTPPPATPAPGATPNSPWLELLPGLLASPGMHDEWDSEVVLEDVRVIAVGADLSSSRSTAIDGGSSARAAAVTIEVSPSEAMLLSNRLAVGSAKVRVLLRASLAPDPI